MRELATERAIDVIVDASHPYAASVRFNARTTALALNIPYMRWLRPSALEQNDQLIVRETHELAAEIACSFGVPVLLTTGSRNLAPYVAAAERAGVPLTVRVLPHPASIEACRCAGIPEERIVTGRGPFTLEENLSVIRRCNIGVIVTKDSGIEGGVPAKIEAAAIRGCRVVVVSRPDDPSESVFSNISELVAAVREALIARRKDLC
jgi:precorrin-6A/cobalt-precorrin-6A reductase